MKDREYRRSLPRRLCAAAGTVCLLLALATGLVRLIAGSGPILEWAMRRTAPPEATGLPAEEYAGITRMIAGYLTGKTAEFQYTLPGEGGTCFQPHEAAHMADCRDLIALDTRVFAAALAAGTALTAAAALTGRKPRGPETRRGMRAGLLCLGAVLSAMLVWAAADFDGFFITFHRLAFTNEGWLLDPRTDLLIRLMPESFFITLGAAGLALFAAGTVALAVPALRSGAGRTRRKHGI